MAAGTLSLATLSADRKLRLPQQPQPRIIYSYYVRGLGHLMDELVLPARPLAAQPTDTD